jgi:uncharacterized Zn finger protein (UPF0148 family)
MKHNCDTEIRKSTWAMSGFRKTGDVWQCSCGKHYEHQEDEAEGSAWNQTNTPPERPSDE